jgi:hypothetical protein
VQGREHLLNHRFALPHLICAHRFLAPTLPPFFAVVLDFFLKSSTKDLSTASSPSFRRARSMTSSVAICVLPACFAKDSRSLATVSEKVRGCTKAELCPNQVIRSLQGEEKGLQLESTLDIPMWAQVSSVSAPINCWVALQFDLRDSSSMICPMEYQRADLSRCTE